MGTPERIYALVKALPADQADQVLDFVEFLRQKKVAPQQIPQGTLTELRGIAKQKSSETLDFRQAAGLGQEIWSSVAIEEYIQQERESWD